MAAPRLAVDWKEFCSQTLNLGSLLDPISTLPVHHRKLIAEIVLVRLFLLIENSVQSICAKILCGASYLDNTSPQCSIKARSASHACDLMRTHSRQKPKRELNWAQSPEIRDNMVTTLQGTDPLFTTVMNHGTLLTDMRYIRNHIVHNNTGSRKNFQKLVRKHYGGLRKGISPGILLLTPKLAPSLLQQFFIESRIFIKSLVRG
jgi:hypothetical protein